MYTMITIKNHLVFSFFIITIRTVLCACLLVLAGTQHLQHNTTTNLPESFPRQFSITKQKPLLFPDTTPTHPTHHHHLSPLTPTHFARALYGACHCQICIPFLSYKTWLKYRHMSALLCYFGSVI